MFEMVRECVEVVELTPHERGQRQTDEHIVDVPIPLLAEETVEMLKLVPQERVKAVPQEQFSERICDQIVDVAVPQVYSIEAIQLQVRATSNEIEGKYCGKIR